MRTDTPFVLASHESGLPRCVRRISNGMKVVPAALLILLVSFGASAYAGDGFYVGVGGGLSMLNDNSVTAPARDPFKALNANARTNDGFAVRGMAGYAFPSGFRLEAEIDYRRHNTDEMDVSSAGGIALSAFAKNPRVNPMGLPPRELLDQYRMLPEEGGQLNRKLFEDGVVEASPHIVNGNFSMLAFMANVDYDFDTGSRWVPYVGGGLGVATISIDTEDADGVSLADDSDTVFAYQVGAGLGYEFPLEEGRSVTVSLDWRYFATQDPTFKGDVTGAEFDVGISGHDVGMSIIYGF